MKKIDIKAKIKFYNWAKKRGIDLKSLEVESLDFSQPLAFSTFKFRANEIKTKYNYSFNLNVSII